MIGVELRNPRRLEDEDVATQGSAPHSYWLRYDPTVVLTTGEQMRFASEDELLAAHTVPHYAVANLQLRGAKSFVDARPFGLPPQQSLAPDEQRDGQGQPSSSPSPPAQPASGVQPQVLQTDNADLPPVPSDDWDVEDAPDSEVETPQQPQQPPAVPQPIQQPARTQQQHAQPRLPISAHQRQMTIDEPEPAPAVPATPHAVPRLAPQSAPRTPLNTAMQLPDRLDA